MWIIYCLFMSLLFNIRASRTLVSRGFCKKTIITPMATQFLKDRLNPWLEPIGRLIGLILLFTHLNRLI